MANFSPSPQTSAAPARPASGVREADPAQVSRWLAAGQAVLIDVRDPDEHARERIDGARLVPLPTFDPAAVLAEVKPGQRLVLHCKRGGRSADACRLAIAAAAGGPGVELYSLSGGIEGWKAANLPTRVDARVGTISVMRQTQLVIGAGVLIGSALAYFVHPGWAGLSAFFGFGLMVAGSTGTCGLAVLLSKMPWNRAACAAKPH